MQRQHRSSRGNLHQPQEKFDAIIAYKVKESLSVDGEPVTLEAADASVWVATSDDVPGLVTESKTFESLLKKLRTLVPELLELNGVPADRMAKFHVRYEHEESDVLAS